MIPVPEIRLSVDCVPCAEPFTSMLNPAIPAPVQSVLLLVGSSLHPPPVKFSVPSTGRFVPPFWTRAIAPFDPVGPVGPLGPLAPLGPVGPTVPDCSVQEF